VAVAAASRRVSAVESYAGGAVRQQRSERTGSVVANQEEVEELRREGLLAAQTSASAPRARRDGFGYADEPTRNVEYLVPELERLVVADEPKAHDWFQRTRLRRAVRELLFRPGAYIFFFLGVLIPAWGPFAVAHMVGRPLSSVEVVEQVSCSGPSLTHNDTWRMSVPLLANGLQAVQLNASDCAEGLRTVVLLEGSRWSECCFVLLAVWSITVSLMVLVDFTTLSPSVVRLALAHNRFSTFFVVGTRLVYTAAAVSCFPDGVHAVFLVHMVISCVHDLLRDARTVGQLLRNTRHSTEAGASNLFELFIDIIRALEAVLDVGRHLAVLYAARDGATTVRTIAASVGSRQLALTNVDVMSATFTASVVLNLRTVWVSGRSRGKVLPGLTTRFSVRVVDDDDGAEWVASSAAHGQAELLARFAPRRVVAGDDWADGPGAEGEAASQLGSPACASGAVGPVIGPFAASSARTGSESQFE
jgi:hypothetical protein